MKEKLKHCIEEIHDDELRKTCETLLHYPNFLTWPASLGFHHAYEGGLLAHTLEVMDYAMGIVWIDDPRKGAAFPQIKEDILRTAALWHDLMKIEEYVVVTHNQRPERSLLKTQVVESEIVFWDSLEYWAKDPKHTELFGPHSHIIASANQFNATAINCGVNKATRDAVVHCILSHHGPVKEWGSPVAPVTLEALVLHQADMLSAKFGATKEVAQ